MNKTSESSSTKSRNTLALLAGGVIAIGVGLVGLYTMVIADNGDDTEAVPDTVSVLALTEDLAVGTAGDAIVAENLYQAIEVERDAMPIDAVVDPSQLSGRELARPLEAGETLTGSALVSTALSGAVVVPDGYQAVAITLPFDPAGGGYVQAGDRIDIYSVIAAETTAVQEETTTTAEDGTEVVTPVAEVAFQPPIVQSLLDNVEVLDISADLDPRYQSAEAGVRPSLGNITYLLALTPEDAATLIYVKTNYSIYLALTSDTVADDPVRIEISDVRNDPRTGPVQ